MHVVTDGGTLACNSAFRFEYNVQCLTTVARDAGYCISHSQSSQADILSQSFSSSCNSSAIQLGLYILYTNPQSVYVASEIEIQKEFTRIFL